jgi:hypothetical protein
MAITPQPASAPMTAPALCLTADPPEIRVGGIDQSTITARIWDGDAWIAEGPIVNFSTDLGSITPSVPITNGTATAILTSGTIPGLATVTAIVNLPEIGLLTNVTTITFRLDTPPLPQEEYILYLSASPTNIPADRCSTATINATVWVWMGIEQEYVLIWYGPYVNFSTDLGEITPSAQIEDGVAVATLTSGTTPGVATVTAEMMEEGGYATNTTAVCFTATEFDTGMGTYPSIAGTCNGTIMLYHPITVQTLYSYPCEGTGGHTEYAAFYYPNGTLLAETSWSGYGTDWRNLAFPAPFTLQANVTYTYTLKTGSYPQRADHLQTPILHGGEVGCTTFTDVNGRVYHDWIPAIKLVF